MAKIRVPLTQAEITIIYLPEYILQCIKMCSHSPIVSIALHCNVTDCPGSKQYLFSDCHKPRTFSCMKQHGLF